LIIETKYPHLLFGSSLWSHYELIRSQIEVVMRLYPGNQMLAMPRKKVRYRDHASIYGCMGAHAYFCGIFAGNQIAGHGPISASMYMYRPQKEENGSQTDAMSLNA
jgi:hypothetical protein